MPSDAVDIAIQLLYILTQWQVLLFFALVLFRNQIRPLIPNLVARVQTIPTPWGSLSFFEQANKGALKNASAAAAERGESKEEVTSLVSQYWEKATTIMADPPSARSIRKFQGRSILWVDDQPLNNAYEASLMERLGARIKQVTSTVQALEALKRDRYDLIISDVKRIEKEQVNSQAGYDLLDELARRKITTPVVFYMGNKKYFDQMRGAMAKGVADQPEELLTIASAAL